MTYLKDQTSDYWKQYRKHYGNIPFTFVSGIDLRNIAVILRTDLMFSSLQGKLQQTVTLRASCTSWFIHSVPLHLLTCCFYSKQRLFHFSQASKLFCILFIFFIIIHFCSFSSGFFYAQMENKQKKRWMETLLLLNHSFNLLELRS